MFDRWPVDDNSRSCLASSSSLPSFSSFHFRVVVPKCRSASVVSNQLPTPPSAKRAQKDVTVRMAACSAPGGRGAILLIVHVLVQLRNHWSWTRKLELRSHRSSSNSTSVRRLRDAGPWAPSAVRT
ncbi:hypothetical protein AVEN_30364-1 [Araneus ventricosus]|uniref:Uncharacterized protein n=1 Tax=Araneus ventricosus TaxID=182803 RepID=A0A4Y2NKL6_ARAVE|nr:hypothetical protein AVEN_30364-1 [Araneus ventricosus]